MRILLAAGSGFIGSATAAALLDAGHDVTVWHRGHTDAGVPAGARRLHERDAVRRQRWDVVVHFLLLNRADARAAVADFADAGRLLALSSGDVYRAYGELLGHEPPHQSAPPPLLGEEAPLRASRYPYGRDAAGPWGRLVDYDKILVEAELQAAPLAWTILRLPKVYGPGARDRPLCRWIDWMRDHTEVPVGTRQGRWRWTHGHVRNVAAAIALAASDARAASRIYNVGERETPTQRRRVADLARALGWRGAVCDVDDATLPPALSDPHAGAPDLAYDTSRIRAELGYVEPLAYDDALRTLV